MASTPHPPVPGVAKVIFHGTLDSVNVANVVHVSYGGSGPLTQTEADLISSGMRSNWQSTVVAHVGSNYQLGNVETVDLSTVLGVVGNQGGSSAGAGAAPFEAANVALCVTWKIARHYRGGRPRTYICGIVVGNRANANTWTAGTVTNWTTYFTAFKSTVAAMSIPTRTMALVCVHYRVNKTDQDPPLVDPITGVTVDDRVDSQRRRLGRDR
jgi:hypothetical protein